MKMNFTLRALFAFAVIMSAAFLSNVSAQTERNCTSSKITNANELKSYSPGGSTTVVINEVYGGSETGGVYNADFIELYNLSAVPVDISDYSVQYYTAGQINGGAPTSTAHIPSATILAAFSYYVIRVSPADRAGAPLPCEDLNAAPSFAETGIASDGGKLVLTSNGVDLPDCTSALNVLDRIGWGSLPMFVCNETNNAGQPSSSRSVQRKAFAMDTDDNAVDFKFLNAPTPCAPLLAPTAAKVNVGGRVTNANGLGISKALITMISAGVVRTAYTAPFGYYNFDDVEVGQTLIIEVSHKHYAFKQPTQVIFLTEELTLVDFTAY